MSKAPRPDPDPTPERDHEAAADESLASGEGGGLLATVAAEELTRLRALADEAEEHRERALRVAADLQNFRRRMERDVEERSRRKAEPLLLALLDGVDELDRALAAAGSEGPLAEGVGLIRDSLREALGREGVREIPSVGEPFDPKVHEAIAQVPAGDAPPGSIVAEQRKGWLWGDRVLRAPQVVVAAGASAPAGGDEPSASDS